jgi:hypothetical protein
VPSINRSSIPKELATAGLVIIITDNGNNIAHDVRIITPWFRHRAYEEWCLYELSITIETNNKDAIITYDVLQACCVPLVMSHDHSSGSLACQLKARQDGLQLFTLTDVLSPYQLRSHRFYDIYLVIGSTNGRVFIII